LTAALDEEMMAATDESIADYRNVDAFSRYDWFFAHGDVERASHISRGCDPNKVYVPGNSRLDILKGQYRAIFDDEVARIRAQYGRFVLVNTNFGTFNSIIKSRDALLSIQKRAVGFDEKNDTTVKQFLEFGHWERQNYEALCSVLAELR
jgi:surface carbohydrate biosynthesis protein